MLEPGVRVEIDPENSMSIRVVGERKRRGLILQLNGNQKSDEERSGDASIVVDAINRYLSP